MFSGIQSRNATRERSAGRGAISRSDSMIMEYLCGNKTPARRRDRTHPSTNHTQSDGSLADRGRWVRITAARLKPVEEQTIPAELSTTFLIVHERHNYKPCQSPANRTSSTSTAVGLPSSKQTLTTRNTSITRAATAKPRPELTTPSATATCRHTQLPQTMTERMHGRHTRLDSHHQHKNCGQFIIKNHAGTVNNPLRRPAQ